MKGLKSIDSKNMGWYPMLSDIEVKHSHPISSKIPQLVNLLVMHSLALKCRHKVMKIGLKAECMYSILKHCLTPEFWNRCKNDRTIWFRKTSGNTGFLCRGKGVYYYFWKHSVWMVCLIFDKNRMIFFFEGFEM